MQDDRCHHDANDGHGNAQNQAKSNCCVNGKLCLLAISSPDAAGDNDTGAGGKAHEKAGEQEDKRTDARYCRKSSGTKEVADNQGICRVVHLLKQIADKQRDRKKDDLFAKITFGH